MQQNNTGEVYVLQVIIFNILYYYFTLLLMKIIEIWGFRYRTCCIPKHRKNNHPDSGIVGQFSAMFKQ